jgi:hypothetical protein
MTQLFDQESHRDRAAREPRPDGDADSGSDSGERISGLVPRVDEDSSPSIASLAPAPSFAYLRKNISFLDAVVAIYFTLMLGAVTFGTGPNHEAEIKTVLVDYGLFAMGILLTRGGVLKPGSFWNAMGYRVTIFCSVFLTYFQLRHILPAVSPHALDGQIYAFDLRVFGVEPSVAWDKFVNPNTVEWFSFFYFGYFFILSAHVLPMLFNAHSRFRIAHFALGIVFVFCTGHLIYMLVPGWGPYHYLGDHFEHPLQGGLFWRLVRAAVDGGGAQKDIFPSLHTAAPTYFAIYSYIHRRSLPYRYTWPFVAFAATQIIGATMFLRWHYLIDICAGLTLATVAAVASYKIVQWETNRREQTGAPPIFTLLEWPWQRKRLALEADATIN